VLNLCVNFTVNTDTFGQYIIGATLTASITQTAFSKTSLSIFGLVVIICSAAKQQFHPDETAKESTQTARRLNALVRYAQDQITVLEIKSLKGEDRTDAFISLLNEITLRLNQIETADGPIMTVQQELPQPPPSVGQTYSSRTVTSEPSENCTSSGKVALISPVKAPIASPAVMCASPL
jgi:hypothetical protein